MVVTDPLGPARPLEEMQLGVYGLGPEEGPTFFRPEIKQVKPLNAERARFIIPDGSGEPVDLEGLFWSDAPIGEADRRPTTRSFSSLLGNGGMRLRPGASGFVAGDRSCGRWHVPGTACDYVCHEAIAAGLGLEGELFRVDQRSPDGSLLCAGIHGPTDEAYFVASIGTSYFDMQDFAARVAGHRCESSEVDIGAEAVHLDCPGGDSDSLLWRTRPAAIDGTWPDGGLEVSVDIATDQPTTEEQMANMVKEFSQTDGKLAVEATARDPWASAP